MKRTNTTTWRDCEVLLRKCHELQEALMNYQKYALPDETRGQGCLGGDSNVIVAAIGLRNRLEELTEKARKHSERQSNERAASN